MRSGFYPHLTVVLGSYVSEHVGAGEVGQGHGVPHPPGPRGPLLALASALVFLLGPLLFDHHHYHHHHHHLLLDPPDRVIRMSV